MLGVTRTIYNTVRTGPTVSRDELGRRKLFGRYTQTHTEGARREDEKYSVNREGELTSRMPDAPGAVYIHNRNRR